MTEQEQTQTPPAAEPAAQPSYEQLALTLQDAQAKADEYWNQLLRTRAEMENIRRRAERDVQQAHKYALERIVDELLPVLDSLEAGLQAANAPGADVEKLREGTSLTLKMLVGALEKSGVVQINPQGQRFNPELHQAMAMQDVPNAEPNTVVVVYQKGYQLNDRLIRPARVVVASANSGSAGGEAPPATPRVDEMA